MFKRTPLLILISALIVITSTSLGLGVGKKEKEKKKDKKISTVVLPIIFYMPETRWGLGGGGLLTYRAKGNPENARPSSLYFSTYYTQNKQYCIELKPEIYLKNEAYIINSYLKISKFPNKFWGYGNQTLDEAGEDYTPKMFNFDLSLQRRILSGERLYFGIQYKFENLSIVEVEENKQLASGLITGSEGGKLSSLGFILNWDKRDNIFFPHKGNYFQLTSNFNSPIFGSDFKFTTVKIDLRKYFPVFKSHVFAVQAILQTVNGSPTFRHMSEIGGEMVMRGFGAVVFASVSDVTDKLGKLSLGNLKYSVGIGLRILVVPKEGTNIRLDYGFGKGTSGYYITANEAF